MRIVLIGPNGSGKSMLMSALAGSLSPRSGIRTTGRWLQLLKWDHQTQRNFGDDDDDDDEDESPVQCERSSEYPSTHIASIPATHSHHDLRV